MRFSDNEKPEFQAHLDVERCGRAVDISSSWEVNSYNPGGVVCILLPPLRAIRFALCVIKHAVVAALRGSR